LVGYQFGYQQSRARLRAPEHQLRGELFTTICDWRISSLDWMFHAVLRRARFICFDLERLVRSDWTSQNGRILGAALREPGLHLFAG
jgi:hypothetical protein